MTMTAAAFISTLTPRERAVHEKMRRGRDVPIEEIFVHVYGKELHAARTPRRRQQLLGPHITRLNYKLVEIGWIVRPGVEKRTYRMYPLHQKPPRKTSGKPAARR